MCIRDRFESRKEGKMFLGLINLVKTDRTRHRKKLADFPSCIYASIAFPKKQEKGDSIQIAQKYSKAVKR